MRKIIEYLKSLHTHSYPKMYQNYMVIEGGAVDGVGRQHCTLKAKCEICDKWIRVGMIHMKEDFVAPKYNKVK